MKKNIFTSKRFIYGTGSTVISIAFIAFVIIINIVIGNLTTKFSLKADFTSDKLYKLSDDTVQFVKKLDRDVDIFYFSNDITITSGITETLEKIAALNKHISYKIVAPDKNPSLAQKYTSKDTSLSNYSIVVDGGETFKLLEYSDLYSYNQFSGQYDVLVAESRIVSAINTVSRSKSVTVGFIGGHGEDGAQTVKKTFDGENIKYSDINLMTDDPASFDVLFVAAPMVDFTATEIDILDNYLKNGGRMQIYFGYNSDAMPKLDEYLAEWGIQVGYDMVQETNSNKIVGSYPYNFVTVLNEHDITKSLIENKVTNIVQLSRSVTPLWEGKNGFVTATVQKTGEKAVAQPFDSSATQKSGEISLSVISEYNGEKSARSGIVFASGSYLAVNGEFAAFNTDMLVGTTVWMSDENETMNISPKLLMVSKMKISQLQTIVWMFAVIYIIPLAIFIAGLFVWYKRRHL